MSQDNSALVESIFNQADPLAAREYATLVLSSVEPKVLKEYFELRQKMREKRQAGDGTVMSVTFDFSGTGVQMHATAAPAQPALEVVEQVEADDLRLDEIAPQPEVSFDLGELLGIESAPEALDALMRARPQPAPRALEPPAEPAEPADDGSDLDLDELAAMLMADVPPGP